MNKKELFFGVLIGVLSVFAIVFLVVDKKMESISAQTRDTMSSNIERSVELSKLLAQGAVTDEVAAMIPDCPIDEMVAYDSLLSSLDKGLSHSDLLKLNDLFKACGDVAAKRRSVMTLLLENEVNSMIAINKIRLAANINETDDIKIEKWELLIKKESQISNLFNRLVVSQESIIMALTKGVPATTIAVENIRSSAQKLREEMILLTDEVAKLRLELGVL